MKTKVLFLLALTLLLSYSSFAQRSLRIGYIDTEYILENVPEFQEANAQLDAKVQTWKTEIDQRLSVVEQKVEQLNSESVLLTKELLEERQEEIDIEKYEILDYQQKRFGPNGDLMIQKRQLMQPVQDQIFSAVQEIAGNKNYDFVFDKSTDDMVMLYSADRFDISEQVLRSITRSSKRRQATNKQERKAAEEEDIIPEVNQEKDARAQALEDKKAARQLEIEESRKSKIDARDVKRKEIEAKRQKILEDRAKAREEKLKERNKDAEGTTETVTEAAIKEDGKEGYAEKTEDKTKAVAEDTKEEVEKKLSPKEARKKTLEDKKKKIIADREKANKEKLEAKKVKDSIAAAKKKNDN